MKDKNTILDYIGQVFIIFGGLVLLLCMACLVIGDSVKDLSDMFRLGRQGLSIATLLQFFLVAVLAAIAKFFFFTEVIIKNMSVIGRTIGIVCTMFVIGVGCIVIFKWIELDCWEGWLLFILSFSICSGVSLLVTFLKEKNDNAEMEKALQRFKEGKTR